MNPLLFWIASLAPILALVTPQDTLKYGPKPALWIRASPPGDENFDFTRYLEDQPEEEPASEGLAMDWNRGQYDSRPMDTSGPIPAPNYPLMTPLGPQRFEDNVDVDMGVGFQPYVSGAEYDFTQSSEAGVVLSDAGFDDDPMEGPSDTYNWQQIPVSSASYLNTLGQQESSSRASDMASQLGTSATFSNNPGLTVPEIAFRVGGSRGTNVYRHPDGRLRDKQNQEYSEDKTLISGPKPIDPQDDPTLGVPAYYLGKTDTPIYRTKDPAIFRNHRGTRYNAAGQRVTKTGQLADPPRGKNAAPTDEEGLSMFPPDIPQWAKDEGVERDTTRDESKYGIPVKIIDDKGKEKQYWWKGDAMNDGPGLHSFNTKGQRVAKKTGELDKDRRKKGTKGRGGHQNRKRDDIISVIQKATQPSSNTGDSALEVQKQEFQKYLDTYYAVQSNISTLVYPFIQSITNSTNSTATRVVAMTAYVEIVGLPISVHGPFIAGMNCIKWLEKMYFKGTNSSIESIAARPRSNYTEDDISALQIFAFYKTLSSVYNHAYYNGTALAHSTGQLDTLRNLKTYLMASNTSIMPKEFTTVDTNYIKELFPQIVSI